MCDVRFPSAFITRTVSVIIYWGQKLVLICFTPYKKYDHIGHIPYVLLFQGIHINNGACAPGRIS